MRRRHDDGQQGNEFDNLYNQKRQQMNGKEEHDKSQGRITPTGLEGRVNGYTRNAAMSFYYMNFATTDIRG